jgi:GntR family transcriptional regulator, transcriptional repressor for pyruvate dehydrogenase complex
VSEPVTAADGPAPKAASLVAAQIRKQIVMGELAEGDALPSEAEMVKRLGVSRPTLRQAFRILEAEHLLAVQRGARGGGTVFRPSAKLASRYLSDLLRFRATTLGDVLSARLMIEPAAVSQLARGHDEQAVDRLRSLVREQRDGQGQDEGAKSADEFHVELVELAGNPVLAQYSRLIHYLIDGQIRSLRATRRGGDLVAVNDSADAHATLVDLVAAGAGHAASEHWRRHLDDVHTELGERLDLNSLLEEPPPA